MKRWFVVQVYTGFEEVVKSDLEKRAIEEGSEELIDDVLIPTGELVSFFGEDEAKKEKIFPGYLLVHIEPSPEAYRLVISVPRVSRFLGGKEPVPLSDKEIDRVFSQMSGKISIGEEGTPFVTYILTGRSDPSKARTLEFDDGCGVTSTVPIDMSTLEKGSPVLLLYHEKENPLQYIISQRVIKKLAPPAARGNT